MKMKNIALFLLISTISLYAQDYKFAWISDTHIGYKNADEELDSVVQAINSFEDLSFTIISGDIGEKGRNDELETAKGILDKLKQPYYIIPGNHDTKWSESGAIKFTELWGDDKFYLEKDNDIYIGLNSGITWAGGGGHIKPEDIKWLEEKLADTDSTKNLFIVTHHPLNEDIDNYYQVTNLLAGHNLKMAMNGHGHANKISEFNEVPEVMTRSSLSKNNDSWGFTIVENSDSLTKFYEVERDRNPHYWGTVDRSKSVTIPVIDSTEFINYNADVKLNLDLEATFCALPVYYNGYFYTSDYSGIVSCFDSTGNMLWDFDAFGNIVSTPTIIDNYFIVGTAQGDLITLNATTGDQLQSIGFDEGITSQLISFEYSGTRQLILPKSTNSNACVVLGTSTGKVYCYDVETLQEYWTFEKPEGMIQTKPLHEGNKIIFGCWDSRIYCIDDRNGLLIWKWDEIKNFYYSPAACIPVDDGKKVYFTSPNKNVYAIDMKLGITSWHKDKYDAWESIGISEDRRLLFVKGFKDKLHVISNVTTNWMQIVKVNYGLDTMPGKIIEQNEKALFNAKNGNIYSVDRKYNHEKVLFMGSARTQSVQKISDELLMASNMDGRITIFSIK